MNFFRKINDLLLPFRQVSLSTLCGECIEEGITLTITPFTTFLGILGFVMDGSISMLAMAVASIILIGFSVFDIFKTIRDLSRDATPTVN